MSKEELLKELLYCISFISVFLLIGFYFRAKIKLFGNIFIPSSVIGGFLLLILGPNGLSLIYIPDDWIKIYSLLPGILIVPVCASIPLGLELSFSKFSREILIIISIFSAMPLLQISFGFLIHFILQPFYSFYPIFGFELGLGYIGGHGSAGILGNILQNMNQPFWKIAQGVTITIATFGLIGGIIIGIIVINLASRKGYTSFIKSPSQISINDKRGYYDLANQNIFGKETTLTTSLDTLAFHLAIILFVCGISYLMLSFIKKNNIPILSEISIWAYAIVIMFILWHLMIRLKMAFLIDNNTKLHIANTFSEFAIITAIASLPVKTIYMYFIPILVLTIGGFILTLLFLYITCRFLLKSFWFEHMISLFGCSTGIFITGLLLLKMCDPNLKSNVIGNYVLSFSVSSIIFFAIINFIISFVLNYGLFIGLIVCLGLSLIFILFSLFLFKVSK